MALGPHGGLVVIYTPGQGAVTADETRPAVVMFNAGLIHHVGPHRMHVKLARALAARGFGAARVDFAGIGDSMTRADRLSPIELMQREAGEVLDELERRGHRTFILLGLCSGAQAARQIACADARVRGVVLINTGRGVATATSSPRQLPGSICDVRYGNHAPG